MEKVYVIYIDHGNRKHLFDIGQDPIDMERTARIMTATDPVFKYHMTEIPYDVYLEMIRKSRAEHITVCSLLETYMNE